MRTPAPIRVTARALGLPVRTVLRERQRVLRALERVPAQRIGGEVLVTFVGMPLGGGHSRVNRHAVWVVQNRTGARSIIVMGAALGRRDAEWLFRTSLLEGATVVFRSFRRCPLVMAAQALGIPYVLEINAEPQAEWQAMRWAAIRYGWALNAWLLQFRGVDVNSLSAYVAWFEALQKIRGTPDPAQAWMALCQQALGVAPAVSAWPAVAGDGDGK